MGVIGKGSYSSFDIPKQHLPNPDPRKYKILRYKCRGLCLVVEIEYEGCTNYEGRKVMLFRNTTINKLKQQGAIDPHFSDNTDMISPFARFEPTELGWYAALRLASDLPELEIQ
jgi:hypothetical protein